MQQLTVMTGRNLKLYFRDKGAVFFSLLSMLIVICLMIFFLGDMNTESVTKILAFFPGRDAAADSEHASLLILSWTCAGILSINAVTVTMSVYSVMIKDRVTGRLNAIYTSPVSPSLIAAGYLFAAFAASVSVCLITLFVTETYCILRGMSPFTPVVHLQLFSMIAVNSFAYASLMYPIALLARTEGAWSALGTVIGTLTGFLGGIYIPVGTLSPTVGNIMKCTPVLYGAAMFRSVMTRAVLTDTFHGIPEETISEYRLAMGIDLSLFRHTFSACEEWMILLLCGIIGTGLAACATRTARRFLLK